MKKTPDKPAAAAAALRQRAEARARQEMAGPPADVAALSPDEARQALHELRVHQIELEMQNEELRRIQAGLDTARTRYGDLYDQAPMGYLTLNREGLIVDANLAAAGLFGVARGALIDQPVTRFIVAADQDNFHLLRRHLATTGAPQACELRVLRTAAAPFWARVDAVAAQDADGTPVARVTVSDISEHRQAEDALQESVRRLKALFDLAPVGIAMLDRERRTMDANPALARILHLTPDALGAQAYFSRTYIRPDGTPMPPAEFASVRAARERRAVYDVETGVVLENGQVVWTQVSAAPLDPAQGTTVVITQDITEHKQAEARRADLETQNRQLQKADSLGRMAAAIAHRFNNRLQAVMGNLELAIEEQKTGARSTDTLSEAMAAARQAATVSSLMLTYLGKTPARLEPADLADICRRSLSMLQAAMPEQVTLATDLPDPGPVIDANPDQIRQLLSNLVTNAGEATGSGEGRIRLTVRTVAAADIPAGPRYPVDWQPLDHAYACLEIADAGSGIEPGMISAIFDPFFSTKFTGRGLGLPVVLGILRGHRGAVTVESAPGRGSVFRVFLPLSAQPAPPPLPPPPASALPAPPVQTGAVLLVEDDASVRRVAARMLALLGFAVVEAGNGMDALQLFRTHRDAIRLVLCDLTMPGLNGWQTLTALRQLAPAIPVILASGYDEASVMAGEHPEQPQAFISKPYQLENLRAALDKAAGIS